MNENNSADAIVSFNFHLSEAVFPLLWIVDIASHYFSRTSKYQIFHKERNSASHIRNVNLQRPLFTRQMANLMATFILFF